MNKIVNGLFVLLLLLNGISANSQTTSEIYNYITKGYVTTISQGLDMKKGYAYTELTSGSEFEGSLSSNKYQFSYRKFYEEKAPDKTVAFMIVLSKNGNFDRVFCMPTAGSSGELWTAFWKDITARLYADQKEKLLFEIAVLFSAYYKEAEEK